MTLKINGRTEELSDGLTIGALLTRLGLRRDGVAVAVNGAVIPRSAHDGHGLRAGDQVEVITAVGGG